MDSIKKLTGKTPSEYEPIAKTLIDNSDIELFKKLVKQDDFLFDFIKANVAKRIQNACNKDNFSNVINFLEFYSPSYDTVFAEVLHRFGDNKTYETMVTMLLDGTDSQKAYAVKYFCLIDENIAKEFLPLIRNFSKSEYEPLMLNSIEFLAKYNDEDSKKEAIEKLNSKDEFEQYNAVKFLCTFGAKDTINQIINVMKKSSFSEHIASEIPYMISLSELLQENFDNGLLVLCNIINALPEIIAPSSVYDYDLKNVIEEILTKPLESTSAVFLMLAKDKFQELTSNDEYLFDSDKNTKEEIATIQKLLNNINRNKLISYLYDELFDESDFVFFAVDYVESIEELETLLESNNQTLILKVLTILKEKNLLSEKHKTIALNNITNIDIKNIITAL